MKNFATSRLCEHETVARSYMPHQPRHRPLWWPGWYQCVHYAIQFVQSDARNFFFLLNISICFFHDFDGSTRRATSERVYYSITSFLYTEMLNQIPDDTFKANSFRVWVCHFQCSKVGRYRWECWCSGFRDIEPELHLATIKESDGLPELSWELFQTLNLIFQSRRILCPTANPRVEESSFKPRLELRPYSTTLKPSELGSTSWRSPKYLATLWGSISSIQNSLPATKIEY